MLDGTHSMKGTMSGHYYLFFKDLTVFCSFNFVGTEFISRVVDTKKGIIPVAAYEQQRKDEGPKPRDYSDILEGNAALYTLDLI